MHSRSGEKHPSRYVSPHTSFVLQPPPACLTTGQSTVKASLFVNHSGFCFFYVTPNLRFSDLNL